MHTPPSNPLLHAPNPHPTQCGAWAPTPKAVQLGHIVFRCVCMVVCGALWSACGGGIPAGTWTPDAGTENDASEPQLGDGLANAGWVGGACADSTDCHYDQAICLTPTMGYPGGQCSLACERLCPDRDGANSITFCVDARTALGDDRDGGLCVARCDRDLYPNTGCRQGYTCQIQARSGEPQTQTGICIPTDRHTPAPAETTCQQALADQTLTWSPWDYQTRTVEAGGSELRCTVGDPVRVQSPIGNVRFRTLSGASPTLAVNCELALALEQLADVLARHNIREVIHMGTFNCRTIAGTTRLSQHAHGLAIDIWGFVDDQGQQLVIEEDWEIDNDTPEHPRGRLLHTLVDELFEARVFNIILTPDYNAAHRNHLHLDLTPDAHFLGSTTADIGERCPGW